MERQIEKELNIWKHKKRRKSLLLRGARQVGKTYIVRQFGRKFQRYTEINIRHIYVEIDMEMKWQMLQKIGPPDVKKPLPWQKPNILQWLNSLAKPSQLCVVTSTEDRENQE